MCLIERLFKEAAELKSLHDLLSVAAKEMLKWMTGDLEQSDVK
jgi:hypothetical protein